MFQQEEKDFEFSQEEFEKKGLTLEMYEGLMAKGLYPFIDILNVYDERMMKTYIASEKKIELFDYVKNRFIESEVFEIEEGSDITVFRLCLNEMVIITFFEVRHAMEIAFGPWFENFTSNDPILFDDMNKMFNIMKKYLNALTEKYGEKLFPSENFDVQLKGDDVEGTEFFVVERIGIYSKKMADALIDTMIASAASIEKIVFSMWKQI